MSAPKAEPDIEMFVVGLVLDPSSNSPIVILKDLTSDVCLPIWVGTAEAAAIATALKKVEINRPMTHDLLKDVIQQFGGKVVKIAIVALKEHTFIATVEISCGDSYYVIDARPSDAIALAVRAECPIIVARKVLDEAQVKLVAVEGAVGGEMEFRSVDQHGTTGPLNLANIDREQWADILAEMNPEDFKYKM